MVKVTFTLDDETVVRLRRISTRLARAQSHVVREAIKEYEIRSTKLGDDERARMLAVVDRMMKEPPTRSAQEVDAELEHNRTARRRWSARTRRRVRAPRQRRSSS